MFSLIFFFLGGGLGFRTGILDGPANSFCFSFATCKTSFKENVSGKCIILHIGFVGNAIAVVS